NEVVPPALPPRPDALELLDNILSSINASSGGFQNEMMRPATISEGSSQELVVDKDNIDSLLGSLFNNVLSEFDENIPPLLELLDDGSDEEKEDEEKDKAVESITESSEESTLASLTTEVAT
ncbi:Hypothetical protein FKW44_005510, partial [Caligus rogercresseyi]